MCNNFSLRGLTVFFLLVAVLKGNTQTPYFPDIKWLAKSPAELQMNERMLDSAIQFALHNENKVDTNLRAAILKSYSREPEFRIFGPVKPRGRSAGMIIRHGYIVAQWGDVNRVDMTFSVTKSYLSTVAGLAFDTKLIGHIDDKVKDYVQDEKFAGEHNSKISWRHLLTQSSDWSGCLFDFCDWADRPPPTGGIEDWKNRQLIEPGKQFEYNDVRVNLLAYSLLQVWRKPLPVVLKEKIMDPIQASSTWRWYGYDNSWVNIDGVMTQSVSGGGHFGGGLFINTVDQARFGLLFLRKGKWKDQQLISGQWVEDVHKGSIPNPSYGLMWWTNRAGELAGLSPELFYADGFGGNYIVVDNQHDLVVAVRWLDTDKLGELMKLITKSIEEKH